MFLQLLLSIQCVLQLSNVRCCYVATCAVFGSKDSMCLSHAGGGRKTGTSDVQRGHGIHSADLRGDTVLWDINSDLSIIPRIEGGC